MGAEDLGIDEMEYRGLTERSNLYLTQDEDNLILNVMGICGEIVVFASYNDEGELIYTNPMDGSPNCEVKTVIQELIRASVLQFLSSTDMLALNRPFLTVGEMRRVSKPWLDKASVFKRMQSSPHPYSHQQYADGSADE